jgi:hypothetical protein
MAGPVRLAYRSERPAKEASMFAHALTHRALEAGGFVISGAA